MNCKKLMTPHLSTHQRLMTPLNLKKSKYLPHLHKTHLRYCCNNKPANHWNFFSTKAYQSHPHQQSEVEPKWKSCFRLSRKYLILMPYQDSCNHHFHHIRYSPPQNKDSESTL